MLDLSNRNMAFMDECEILELITQPSDSNSINLSNNHIENITINILPDTFQDIDLSKNRISNIDLKNIKRQKINLSQNQIMDITIKNVECDYLDISNNNIGNITFIDCNIGILDLNTNLIEMIVFTNTFVKELDLSFNKIKFFSSYPKSISSINLFSNKLFGIGNMTNTITKIDLASNKLTELNYVSSNLIRLDISKNLFENFNIKILPKTLNYFDITENKIKDISIFKDLQVQTCLYDSDFTSRQKFNNAMILKDNDSNTSDSDIDIKITKRQIHKIDFSDDSDECNGIEVEIDEREIQDTDSDSDEDGQSSDDDLMKYIQLKHDERAKKQLEDEIYNKQCKDDLSDEFKLALEEYEEEKRHVSKSGNNLFSKSRDIFDFLKDDSSSISDGLDYPQYESYFLRWDVTV